MKGNILGFRLQTSLEAMSLAIIIMLPHDYFEDKEIFHLKHRYSEMLDITADLTNGDCAHGYFWPNAVRLSTLNIVSAL